MKITHYPGKAVVDDPCWLEMDVPNHTRGLQYEANWADATRNLSSSSSSSNSWDPYHSTFRGITSKLGLYQTMLGEAVKRTASPAPSVKSIAPSVKSKSGGGSMRLKYHSQNVLSKINSKYINRGDADDFYDSYSSEDNNDNYISKSSDNNRNLNCDKEIYSEINYGYSGKVKDESKAKGEVEKIQPPPVPKPRTKIPASVLNSSSDEDKNKKSVRFDEKSTEIGSEEIDCENGEVRKSQKEKVSSDSEGAVQERVSEWIDDQNRYVMSLDSLIANAVGNSKDHVQICVNNGHVPSTAGKKRSLQGHNRNDGKNQRPPQTKCIPIIDGYKRNEEVCDDAYEEFDFHDSDLVVRDKGILSDKELDVYEEFNFRETDGKNKDKRVAYNTVPRISKRDKIQVGAKSINLDRNDSGYYDAPKKVRQRIPPRNICCSSTDSDKSDSSYDDYRHKTSSGSDSSFEAMQKKVPGRADRVVPDHGKTVVSYRNTLPKSKPMIKGNGDFGDESRSDFLIPRPKLIVPVHTYAVRKRRTGNLLNRKSFVEKSEEDGTYDAVDQGNLFLFRECYLIEL